LADGDVGYAYWHQVAELLKSAAGMRVRLQELEHVRQCSPPAEEAGNSSEAEQVPCPYLLHSLLSSAHERRRADKEPRERAESQLSSDGKAWLKNFDAPDIASLAKSSTAAIEARATAAAAEAEQLALCVDYYVLNSQVSPRQTLERYRIECELPVGDEKSDADIRVGDDLGRETYLATWAGFAWRNMSLSEAVLRCFCCARFGVPELPAITKSYGNAFDEVVLAIHDRTASVTTEPLLLLSACRRHRRWAMHWSRAYVEEGAQAWMPEDREHLLHPFALILQAAKVLDGPFSDAAPSDEASA